MGYITRIVYRKLSIPLLLKNNKSSMIYLQWKLTICFEKSSVFDTESNLKWSCLADVGKWEPERHVPLKLPRNLVLALFDLLSLLQIITNCSRCIVQCSWSVNLGLLYFRLEKKDTAGDMVRHTSNKHNLKHFRSQAGWERKWLT